ncbi:dienelactone hydrolase [Aureobasidium sp. EXF-8845]|nr:dienelactone hydrolase [Aureobasidium sp. EXF-8845]KAI4856151.1 dienelactone hydrolase [Aureobasidium sp. EXF-8846]
MDPLLANPPSTCCITGSLHPTTPQGKITKIGGVDTYIVAPSSVIANGRVLLYFPDAFGLYHNAFAMMDAFAGKGYKVFGVDYFLGDSVGKHTTTPLDDPSFDFEAWAQTHLDSSAEIAEKWVEAVVEGYCEQGTKFACVGYCWGARMVCQQLSRQGHCEVGVIAHPSFLKESDKVTLLTRLAPLHIIAPTTDELFSPQQRARTEEILQQNGKGFSIQVYSNVSHGFATRANLEEPYVNWAKEQCFKSFIEWFDFWLEKN